MPHHALRRGRVLVSDDGHRYRIDQEIAEGGFGVVYRASQLARTSDRSRRTVCVKICGGSRDWHGEAFFGTVTSSRPQVVSLLDSFVDTVGKSRLYVLVFEYLEEGTLEAKLDGSPWPPARARHAVASILRLLEDLHDVGITHRDIKPSNILLRNNALLLGDFGIAKLSLPEDLQIVDAFTPDFSPDDMDRRLEWAAWIDIFQMGLLLYSLLAGEVRTRTDLATLRYLDAPDDLVCWIWHATSRKGMRYADAGEALAALTQLRHVSMAPTGRVGRLRGQRAVITGRFASFTQPALSAQLRSKGVVVQDGVTAETTLLIRGEVRNTLGADEGRKLFAVRERRRRLQRIHIVDEARIVRALQ
ncbi:serine/threonine protein kinase [Williamsia sp. M5A3_1d]